MSLFSRFAGRAKELRNTKATTDREQFLKLIDQAVAKPDVVEKDAAKLERLIELAEQFGLDTSDAPAADAKRPNLWEALDAIREFGQLEPAAKEFGKAEDARNAAQRAAEEHERETAKLIDELKSKRAAELQKLHAAHQATFDPWWQARTAVERRDEIQNAHTFYFGKNADSLLGADDDVVPPLAQVRATDSPELKAARGQYLRAVRAIKTGNLPAQHYERLREDKIAAVRVITELEAKNQPAAAPAEPEPRAQYIELERQGPVHIRSNDGKLELAAK